MDADATITLSDVGTFNANSDVETYVLATAGGSTITLTAAGQNVTTGTGGADTIDVAGLTATGTFDTVTADIIKIGNNGSIAGVTESSGAVGGALDANNLTLVNGASVSMTSAQHNGFSGTVTAGGTEQITLTTAGTVTGESVIETYVLSGTGNVFTLGAAAQSVNTGAGGSNTVDVSTLTATGTFTTQATDTVKLGNGANIAGATKSGGSTGDAFTATNLTATGNATMTRLQNNGFNGTVSVTGTNTFTMTTAGAVTAITGVDTYQLAAGAQTITLADTGQNVTADGTGGNGLVTIDTGSLTSITGTFTSAGNDTMKLLLSSTSGVDISAVNMTDVNNVGLDTDAGGTMTIAQHNVINSAAGTNQVTLTDVGTFNANSDVETYVLATAGGSTITLTAAGQNVTTGTGGADTIDVAGLTATGTFDTVTADIIKIGNNGSIAGVTESSGAVGGALDANNLTLVNGASVSMTSAQHNGFSGTVTAAGTEQITLTTAGTVTGESVIETYVLSGTGNVFTLGAAAQSVNTGAGGSNTVDVSTLTATGTFTTQATDTVKLGNGADVNGVDSGAGAGGAFTATNLTLASGASVSMTAAQNTGFSGTVTAGGTEQITLTSAGTTTALSGVETYVLATAGGSTITLTAAGQNVTTGTGGADTIDVAGLTATGTFDTVTADIIKIGNNGSIAGVTESSGAVGGALDANNLTLVNGASVSMTSAQHNGFSGTVTAGGTEQITLTTAGTVTGESVIETYVLSGTGNVFTLGAAAQSVNTGAGGSNTVDVSTLTATGTFTTQATDTVKLGNGADVNGVDSGAGAGGAFTATNLTLASGASVSMTAAQNNGFSGTITAAGTETITLTDANNATGLSNVDAYSLAAGDQTFTLGAASQNVTTSTGEIEVSTGSVPDITDAVIDGNLATSLKITVAANTDISDAVITGTQNAQDADYSIDIATDADAIKMSVAQHGLLGTVNDGSDATITLSDVGTFNANSDVETYVLATAGGSTITLTAAGQNVTTGTGGADTIDVAGLTATGTFDTVTADIIKIGNNGSIAGVTESSGAVGGALDANNLTLVNGASVSMTSAQHNGFSGTVTAGGTEQITLTTAGTVTGESVIETYVLSGTGNVFTLGAAAQSVNTGAGGSNTVDVSTLTATGTFTTQATDTVKLGNGANIAGATKSGGSTGDAFTATNLTATGNATMTRLQNNGFNGTVSVTGTNTFTMTTAGAVTAITGVDTYQLAAGAQTITLADTGQNVTADGTGGNGLVTIDTGSLTSITGTFTSAGNDTMKLLLSSTSGVDISAVNMTDVNNVGLDTDAGGTMTIAQHNVINSAAGTNQVTLTDVGTFNANSDVETYVLATAGGSTITLTAAGQNVTTGTGGADTIDVAGLTATGTFDTVTADIIKIGNNGSIAGVTESSGAVGGALDANNLTLVNGASVSMTSAQHNGFSGTVTAAGTEQITLTTAGTVTGESVIETYVLSGTGNVFTLGAAAQSVNTGAGGSNTVDVSTLTATGTFTTQATDTVKLGNGADVNGVDSGAGAGGAFTATNLTLASGASVSMTAAQNTGFSGTVTAGGTEQITLTSAGTTTALSGVETYVLATAGGSTITLTAAGQNVTTGTGGADTIDVAGLTATGTFDTVTADIIKIGNNGSIAGVTESSGAVGGALDANNLTLVNGASVSMTSAQHNGFSGTVTAAGTEQITLTTAGTVTGESVIETYVLSGTGNVFTLGAAAQSVNTGAGGSNTVDVSTLTATGTFTTQATDTVKLGNGADVNGVDSGAGAGGAFTATNLTLASGASVSMTAAQNNGFSGTITAAGTETITLTDANNATGLSNVDAYSLAAGDQTFTLGAASQNVTTSTGEIEVSTGSVPDITDAVIDGNLATSLKITVAANTDISDAVITGTQNAQDADYSIDIATDADAIKMSVAQHGLLGTVNDGSDATITLSDVGTFNANSDVETYVLATAGGSTITLTAAGQNVTTGTGGADTIDVAGLTATGTFDTVTADIIKIGNNGSIAGVTESSGAVGGALDANNLTLVNGASVSMTAAQHNGFSGTVTAGGTEQITLTTAGTVTGESVIETYVLSGTGNVFTLGAAAQSVNTGAGGSNTVDVSTLTATGTFTTQATDTVKLGNGADVNGVDSGAGAGGAFTATNLTLASGASVSMTAAQNNGFSGTVSVGGTNTFTMTTAGAVTAISGVETYQLAAGAQTITLADVGQNVTADGTGGNGLVTIDTGSLTSITGTFTSAGNDTMKLLLSSTSGVDISAVNMTDVNNVGLDTDAGGTMTIAQHNVINSAAGTNQVTLTDVGTFNANSDVETYVLATAGGSTITLTAAGQNVTTGTGGADTIDVAGLTATGTFDTVTADIIKIGNNGSIAGVTESSGAVGGALDANNLTLVNGASVSMTSAQHNGFSGTVTAGGTEQITLTTAGTVTGESVIETYVLSGTGNVFTLGAAAQSVNTGAGGSNTVDVSTLTATGTFTTQATDTVKLGNGANIAGATKSGGSTGDAFTATNLTATGNATMTRLQNNGFNGTVSVTGTNTFTMTTAGAVTAITGVDTYQLAAGAQTITLADTGQNVTADGTGGNGLVTIDTGSLTSITGTFTSAGNDTMKLLLSSTSGVDISAVNMTDVNNVGLDTDAGGTMTIAQHNVINSAAGTNQVTLTDVGTFNANSDVETYVLATAGGSTITLTAAGQNVTTGTGGADTIDVAGLTATGTFDTVTADIIKIGNNGSIAGVTESSGAVGGALDANNLTLVNGASVSMTSAQHNGFSGTVTAAGTEQITLTTAGTVTGESVIETYVLSGTGNVFTLGAAAQSVNTGAGGSNTVDVSTLTATGTFTTQATDTVKLGNGADVNGVDSGAGAGGAFTATNLTLASGASVSMTAAQNTGFSGTVTAGGTEQITLTSAGTTTALSGVETYVLATAGGSTITLTAAGQNVTTGTGGADTIDVAGLTATGTFDTVTADIIKIGNNGSIAGVTESSGAVGGALDANNLTLVNGASVSMTSAQHNGFSGTVTAGGTEQITLTTAGTVTGESVIETYVLSGTGNVFTLGAAAQSVNTGAGGSNTVDVSTLTATGTFTTQATDTVKLGNGANIAGATKSGGSTGDAFTATNLTATGNATMTRLQNNGFNGTVSVTGTNTFTMTTAGAVTAITGVDTYQLAAGAQTITLADTGQNVTADGTGGNGLVTIDTGSLTSITGTFTSAGNDTMKLLLSSTSGVDISAVNMTDVNNVGLDTDAGGTMTIAQHNVINSAAGTNQVTLTDVGTFNANSDVETYVLATAGGSTITLTAAGQNVTTGTGGADTIDVAGLTATGTFDTVTADIIKIGNNGSIAGVTESSGAVGGALDANNLTLVNGASVSMTAAQHNGFSGTVTAGGTEQITLTTAGTVTGESVIETYVLSGTGNVFTLGAAAQSVNTGAGGSNTVDVSTLTATGTFTTQATDTVKLGNGADVNGVDSGAGAGGAFTATNLTLASGASVSMTAAQNNGFSGTVSVGGTNTFTMTTAGAITAISGVETYQLAAGAQTITLADVGQNVTADGTGGNGLVTIDTGSLTSVTGTFTSAGNDTMKLLLSSTSGVDISAVTMTDVDNVGLDTDADGTMTIAQHNVINSGAGTNKVTLTGNGTVTGNSAIEEYALASGANNFTLANVSQTVTGNSGVDEIVGGSGDDTISGLGGDDILSGGLGADRIIGGADEDTLTGGGGADTFVFATGASGSTESTKDTIQDYNAAEDTLEFDVTHSDAIAYTEVNAGADGLRMFGDEFITNAETAFGTGTNVYFAAAIGGTANGYLAVDIDGDGQFDGGTDVFIEMTGLSSVDDLSAADITFV